MVSEVARDGSIGTGTTQICPAMFVMLGTLLVLFPKNLKGAFKGTFILTW